MLTILASPAFPSTILAVSVMGSLSVFRAMV